MKSNFAILLALLLVAATTVLATPSLYVTMHGGKKGVNTVYSYGLDGSVLNTDVAQGDANQSTMRSMAVMPDGSLLVVNAVDSDSHISSFSSCSNGVRQFNQVFADSTHLSHPYGIAYGVDPTTSQLLVWATNQDTYDLIQYTSNGSYSETVHNFGSDELRSIAFDSVKSMLYITDETQNAVLAYDVANKQFAPAFNIAPITDPIGLAIDPYNNLLYIGTNDPNTPAVIAYSLTNRQIFFNYTDPSLSHPAGITLYEDQMFVISQKSETVLQFNTSSQTLINNQFIANFPDTPEQIVTSYC